MGNTKSAAGSRVTSLPEGRRALWRQPLNGQGLIVGCHRGFDEVAELEVFRHPGFGRSFDSDFTPLTA